MSDILKQPDFSDNERVHHLLGALDRGEDCSQRALAEKLEISLGKVNYLIKELLKRGIISAKSFTDNPEKMKKIRYMLTKKGFKARVELTQYFLKKKENEYFRLKREWEDLNNLSNQNINSN